MFGSSRKKANGEVNYNEVPARITDACIILLHKIIDTDQHYDSVYHCNFPLLPITLPFAQMGFVGLKNWISMFYRQRVFTTPWV